MIKWTDFLQGVLIICYSVPLMWPKTCTSVFANYHSTYKSKF